PTTPKRPTVASAAPSQSTGGARRITGGSGTRRAATATVRSAGGITVANARRHEPASTNQPPSIGLTAPTSAVAADHVPMAAPRSARGNAPLRSARLFGTRSAPASPCAARAAMSQRASGAALPATEASATPASPGGRSATIIRRNRRAVRSRRPFSSSGSAQASPLDLIKVTDAGMSESSSRLRAQREALAHQLLRDLPQTLGVLWVERVRLDAVEGVGSVVHRGHVTVLEIETAAPLALRRGGGEQRGRAPGLDALALR